MTAYNYVEKIYIHLFVSGIEMIPKDTLSCAINPAVVVVMPYQQQWLCHGMINNINNLKTDLEPYTS